ncbi:phage head closure protein [Bosea sp. SSUT16]|jgi:SPP1 family predicted phage head-tail adaptor|uniref:Phage head closure protein n=1 Tax=Bosea spartocytisi TaxID=2773451 RepID=A0A927E533_9HYPH|nr:phage head closure protein [Bosea spartocytisi]MBD3844538.1 phage head closure protein [Bosea spartocytisi]MCT4470355.1 phage head closure protein [Bosea spartocytisi]
MAEIPIPAIGRMRRRLVLEAPVAAPDGLGGATQSFAAVGALWAQLEWLSGVEQWREGRPEQLARYRVALRWRGDVDAGRRLRDGERIFDIRTVADPDGSRRRLVCLVEEVKP